MNHMNLKRESSVLIAGVLAVVVILAACAFIWLAFDSMPAIAVVLGWGVAATLPFLMREASLRLMPRRHILLRHH